MNQLTFPNPIRRPLLVREFDPVCPWVLSVASLVGERSSSVATCGITFQVCIHRTIKIHSVIQPD